MVILKRKYMTVLKTIMLIIVVVGVLVALATVGLKFACVGLSHCAEQFRA